MDSAKINGLNSAPPPASHATPRRNADSTLQNRFLMALHVPKKSASDDAPPGVANTAWRPLGLTPELPTTPLLGSAAEPEPSAELTALLERVSSAMYVSEKSIANQRVVLGLDHVLPGAAAELLREGAHLTIRLHARTDSAHRLMSQQREALFRTLGSDCRLHVDVVVVRGDAHG